MKHNLENWVHFFPNEYFNFFDRSVILRELILTIRKFVQPPAEILEVGCGSGITSLLLESIGYYVTGIDAQGQLVDNLKRYKSVFPNASFLRMDMFSLEFEPSRFGLVFSQGVLEHYADAEVIAALREQRRVAKIGVLDIPNGRGKLGDYGDERAISNQQWEFLLGQAGLQSLYQTSRGMSRFGKLWRKLPAVLDNTLLERKYGENSIFVFQ